MRSYAAACLLTVAPLLLGGCGSTKTSSSDKSDDAALKSLVPSGGTLSPTFAADVFAYGIALPHATSALALTPTVVDPGAHVTVNGAAVASGSASASIGLKVGTTPIAVVVTAADGVTQQATQVTASRAPSSDANLSSLSLSAGTLTPAFAEGTTSYAVQVANSVSSLSVIPVTDDPTATVLVNDVVNASGAPSAPIPLNVYDNPIDVTVTAQDGNTTVDYHLVVTRAPSDDAHLGSIDYPANGTLAPALSDSVTAYTLSFPAGTTSAKILPLARDSGATVSMNGQPIAATADPVAEAVPGTVTVAITAADGATMINYTLTLKNGP